MRKTNLIIAVLLISLTSCFLIPPPTGYYNPYCYDGKNTGLDTMLNINGYYLIVDSVDTEGKILAKDNRTYHNIIFYKDGFFTYVISGKHFEFNERWNDWGLYKIYNDTIKVIFSIPRTRKWRPAYGVWYKIINKNKIEALVYGYRENLTQERIDKRDRINFGNFVPCDTLPDPDKIHFKKEKVFWCSKELYKKWKQEQKQNKK